MPRFEYGKNVFVRSAAEVEGLVDLIAESQDEPVSVISIASPDADELPQLERAHRVLRLAFDDDEPGYDAVYPDGRRAILIDAATAHAIAVFADTAPGPIVVNCPGGVSRSAAVAAALIRASGGDDGIIWKTKYPNAYVYRLVLDAATRVC